MMRNTEGKGTAWEKKGMGAFQGFGDGSLPRHCALEAGNELLLLVSESSTELKVEKEIAYDPDNPF